MEVLLDEDTQHGRYLTFALRGESFGLEISYVREIVGMQPITPLPEAPRYVKGIINLRGNVIPVIDMCLKFGKEPSPYTNRTCIIVVEAGGSTAGLIADNVSEVMSIGDDCLVPPPVLEAGRSSEHVKAIGKVGSDVKLILDCKKLIGANSALHYEIMEDTR